MSIKPRALRAMDTGEGYFGFKNTFFHFQGETLDGKPSGPGLLRLSNGVTVQGEFVKGELKGPGTKRWPDGSIFYGTFENGEPHGFGRHFSTQSLQDYEGYYERGYKKGFGVLTDHVQGTVYTGEFNRDFPNGKGELRAIGGDLTSPLCVKGYWENGRLNGLAMATLTNGDKAVGMCKDGLWIGHGSFSTTATPFMAYQQHQFELEEAEHQQRLAELQMDMGLAATGYAGSFDGSLGFQSIERPAAGAGVGGVGGAFFDASATVVGGGGDAANANTTNSNNAAAEKSHLPLLANRSAISYRGQFVDGVRSELPNALKLRSAVLLCNRAPLEKIDPDFSEASALSMQQSASSSTTNEVVGMQLWGGVLNRPQTSSPPSRHGGSRSPQLLSPKPAAGRVGGGGLPPTAAPPRKGTASRRGGGSDQPPPAEHPPPPPAAMLLSAPSRTPLRLQVSLAGKSYRTFPLGSHGGVEMGNGLGGAVQQQQQGNQQQQQRNGSVTTVSGGAFGGVVEATSALGGGGRRSSSASASQTASKAQSVAGGNAQQQRQLHSPLQSPKRVTIADQSGGRSKSSSKNSGGKGPGSKKKRRKGQQDVEDEGDEEEVVMVTEEVLTAQRSESGRRLFARLYHIRNHIVALPMLYQRTAPAAAGAHTPPAVGRVGSGGVGATAGGGLSSADHSPRSRSGGHQLSPAAAPLNAPQTAEEWASLIAKQERVAQRRAAAKLRGLADGGDEENFDDEEDENDAADSDQDDSGAQMNLNASVGNFSAGGDDVSESQAAVDDEDSPNRRRSSAAGGGGVTPAESNFSPRSVATESLEATPRGGVVGGKGNASKAVDRRQSNNNTSPTSGALQPPTGAPPPPPPTKAEMLMSLMRYLQPKSLAEALKGKRLPPGVCETVFGVGGTPPRGTPRGGRGGAEMSGLFSQSLSVDNLVTSLRSNSPLADASSTLYQPTVAGKGAANAAAGVNNSGAKVQQPRSNRPRSSEGGGGDFYSNHPHHLPLSDGDHDGSHSPPHGITPLHNHVNSPLYCNGVLIKDPPPEVVNPSFDFPTEEELSGVCQDGTASFEFFLPADGEYLLEVFVADYCQLSPGNEDHCCELAASVFVPFVATSSSSSANLSRGGRDREEVRIDDDDGEGADEEADDGEG